MKRRWRKSPPTTPTSTPSNRPSKKSPHKKLNNSHSLPNITTASKPNSKLSLSFIGNSTTSSPPSGTTHLIKAPKVEGLRRIRNQWSTPSWQSKIVVNQFVACGKLPTANEDIVESIKVGSFDFVDPLDHLRIRLKPDLQEKRDYEFIGK